MKRTIKLTELRALGSSALTRKINELEAARDRARLDAKFGSVSNHQALRQIRQQLAQAKTLEHAARLTKLESQ